MISEQLKNDAEVFYKKVWDSAYAKAKEDFDKQVADLNAAHVSFSFWRRFVFQPMNCPPEMIGRSRRKIWPFAGRYLCKRNCKRKNSATCNAVATK